MKNMEILIRVARKEDAGELLRIYAFYVENTAITFEHKVPTLEEFTDRIKETLNKYPYLVALVDGKVAGYIYASEFRTRASYIWSASTSIYIDKQYHRMGIGKLLYAKLESILLKQNIVNVYAGVADPVEEDEYLTRNSEHFHEAMGYKVVARYHECGSKFGRWYNLIEMEKIIGDRSYPPKEFIPFQKIEVEHEKSSKLFIGFKGKNNSSNRLVQRLTKDGYFLTNSFQGIKQDIALIEQKTDVVYMFGIDKNLKDEVRIEMSARREGETLYSVLDLQQISKKLENVGIRNSIVDNPTCYLCNEAYWYALNKFDGKVVFIHIPSIKNYNEKLAERIERAIV